MNIIEEGHVYEVASVGKTLTQKIVFLKKENKNGELVLTHDGITNEDLIDVLLNRMLFLNNKVSSEENFSVIHALVDIKRLLEQRTKDRIVRGVENSDQK